MECKDVHKDFHNMPLKKVLANNHLASHKTNEQRNCMLQSNVRLPWVWGCTEIEKQTHFYVVIGYNNCTKIWDSSKRLTVHASFEWCLPKVHNKVTEVSNVWSSVQTIHIHCQWTSQVTETSHWFCAWLSLKWNAKSLQLEQGNGWLTVTPSGENDQPVLFMLSL